MSNGGVHIVTENCRKLTFLT